uniref:THUMP domain-containing protein 1 n=1 Tax=Nothoprocta perdicaria TaxID=30464 RepID=A0A8C6YXV0_NOTPE
IRLNLEQQKNPTEGSSLGQKHFPWTCYFSGRARGGRQLEAGMRGILITCNMNERKCVGEAYSLRLREDDVEAALRKEVGQIRASTEHKLRRFQSVESGANNVVFIRTQGIEPENLVHHILKDMHTTKKKKTRVILRMLPISGTCKAFMEDMKKYTETFFEPWFKVPNKGTFQIVYKARNNSHMSREEVIKELAGIVGSLNPENKVDLNNPQYTIVVEIIKNVCCLSVVRDYVLFRKYNLQEVVKSNKEDAQQKSSVTEEKDSKAEKKEVEEEENSKEVTQENKNEGEQETNPKENDILTV